MTTWENASRRRSSARSRATRCTDALKTCGTSAENEHAEPFHEPDFRYLDSRIAQDARAAPADLESSSAENGRRSSLLLDV